MWSSKVLRLCRYAGSGAHASGKIVAETCKVVQPGLGECPFFRVGDDNVAMHSEPPIPSDRVFASIVPGSEQEMNKLISNRIMSLTKSWSLCIPLNPSCAGWATLAYVLLSSIQESSLLAQGLCTPARIAQSEHTEMLINGPKEAIAGEAAHWKKSNIKIRLQLKFREICITPLLRGEVRRSIGIEKSSFTLPNHLHQHPRLFWR